MMLLLQRWTSGTRTSNGKNIGGIATDLAALGTYQMQQMGGLFNAFASALVLKALFFVVPAPGGGDEDTSVLAKALQDHQHMVSPTNENGKNNIGFLLPSTEKLREVAQQLKSKQQVSTSTRRRSLQPLSGATTTNPVPKVVEKAFDIFGKSTKAGHYKYFRVFKIPSNGKPLRMAGRNNDEFLGRCQYWFGRDSVEPAAPVKGGGADANVPGTGGTNAVKEDGGNAEDLEACQLFHLRLGEPHIAPTNLVRNYFSGFFL
ncbi:unnamed protein product [Amoebophrya sp. A120]|nr:unnamed protein product [Amoebophrya sp. A120]|eukprot:GSA120T00020581001.1